LRKERTEGKISTSHSQQLQYASNWSAVRVSESEGAVAVVRQWGITDDLFAHWLQALSGRQVILVLDTPYASAFAAPGRHGLQSLSGGLTRLGNLGQREIALLGACGEQLSDVLRNPQGLSLMTELLIQSLQAATGPLSLDEAHRDDHQPHGSRLEEVNQKLRAAGKEAVTYRPYLTNTCSRQALLKP